MTNNSWFFVGYFCWFICGSAILYIIFIFFKSSKKDETLEHEFHVREWRNIIPCMIQHTHQNPLQFFNLIEERLKEKMFTEDEIGITLDELIGHAVLCQRNVLRDSKHNLEVQTSRLQQFRLDTESPLEVWSDTILLHIRNVQSAKNILESARANLADIENRRKNVTSNDPQFKLKLA